MEKRELGQGVYAFNDDQGRLCINWDDVTVCYSLEGSKEIVLDGTFEPSTLRSIVAEIDRYHGYRSEETTETRENRKMKQARRVIDFDVAQYLVNYVTREGQFFMDIGSDRCPSASDIRTKLCELKDDQNWIDVTAINQWLCDKQDRKMHGAHAIPHLRELIKRLARTV